jgi:hypothetical protein
MHIITQTSVLSPLFPAVTAIAEAHGVFGCTRFELQDTVLRGSGYAWDIGWPTASPLHAQAAQLIVDKKAADEAAAAQAETERIAAQAAYIPVAISNADLRRGLVELGINPQLITDYIQGLPEGADKWKTWTDWEYANYMERAHPMLDALAPAFGLTSADVDALFKGKPEFRAAMF